MFRSIVSALVCSSVLAAVVPTAAAQSLGDVAKKEQERRKTITPGKVYTNKDIKGQPPPAPAASQPDASADAKDSAKADESKGKDAAGAKPGEAAATGTADSKAAPAAGAVKDKAYWAGRLKVLQDQLDRDETFAVALQSRINGLTAEFVNRDDPAQRAVVERDRNKSLAELDRLKQAIPLDRKALADFQEEARRAGVPPGWLR